MFLLITAKLKMKRNICNYLLCKLLFLSFTWNLSQWIVISPTLSFKSNVFFFQDCAKNRSCQQNPCSLIIPALLKTYFQATPMGHSNLPLQLSILLSFLETAFPYNKISIFTNFINNEVGYIVLF